MHRENGTDPDTFSKHNINRLTALDQIDKRTQSSVYMQILFIFLFLEKFNTLSWYYKIKKMGKTTKNSSIHEPANTAIIRNLCKEVLSGMMVGNRLL